MLKSSGKSTILVVVEAHPPVYISSSKIVISSTLSTHKYSGGGTHSSNGKMIVYDVSGNSWTSGENFSSSRQIYTSDSVAASSTKVFYSGGNSGSSLSNKALFSYTP